MVVRRRFGAQDLQDLYCSDGYPDGDFDLLDSEPAADVFATYERECELADKAAAGPAWTNGLSISAKTVHWSSISGGCICT